MEQAQTSAQRASDRYQQGLILLQTDQQKINELVAKGAQGTPEYAKAVETLALQQDKNRTALDNMNNAQARASESTANFYTQIIPQAVGVLGGLATAISTVPTAWDKVKSALQDTNIFGGLKADTTDVQAAQKDLSAAANDTGTALNTESTAANTASTATSSLKSEALLLAAPFIASTAAVVAFALGMQQIGVHAEDVHNFFSTVDTDISASVPAVKGWAQSFGDALASTGAFFNDNVKQIESWGGLSKSVMNASADDVQKYSDEFARSGQSESYYWDIRFKQWKQAADDSHQSYQAIAKDNIDQIRESQNNVTQQQQQADAVAAAKKKEEDATKHYQDIVKDTSKVLQDDLNKSLDILSQESTGVIKGWEQFGTSGTTVRTAFVDLNTAVVNTSKGLESHNQFADETIKVLTPLQGIAKQVGGTFQTEYNAAMLASIKVHNGVTDSIQPIITHLKAMDDATHTTAAGIDAQKEAFHAAGLAMIDTDGKLQQLEKTIQDGTQINQSFKQGQQDQEQAMRTNEEAIAKEAGSLTTYFAQLATGRPLNDAAVKGFVDQTKAFGDEAVQIATTQGKLTGYYDALQTGLPQLEAFLKGKQDQYQAFIDEGLAIVTTTGKQQEYFDLINQGAGVLQIQQKAVTDLTDAYIKSGEQLITQNTDLTSSQALWTRYETDVNKGKSAVADFEIKLQDTKTAEYTQLTGLKAIADGIGGLPAQMAPTIQNYQDFINANYDGGAALIDFNLKAKKAWSDLTSAGDSFFSALIKSMGETGKTASNDFTKAFTDLPPEIQRILTPQDRESLAVQAAFAHTGDIAGQAFADKAQAALDEGKTPQQALQIGAQWAASFIQGFVQQHPQFAAQANQFFSVLSTGSEEQIKAALDNMAKMPGPLGEAARSAQTALKPTFEKLAPDAKSAVQETVDAINGLGLNINRVSGQVTTATGQIVGNIDKVSGAFTPVSTAVDKSAASIKQLGLDINTTSGQVTTAGGQIVGSVDPVTGSFTAANTSAQTFAATIKGFGDISSAAQIVFQGVVTNANTMATNLDTSFHQMSGFVAQHFGEISSTAKTTFDGILTQANTLVPSLDTTFHQASGFVAQHFGEMSATAQTTFNGMGPNATTGVTQIGTAFRGLPAAVAPAFNTLAQNAQTTFDNMVRAAQVAAQKIAAAFQQAQAANQAPTAQSFGGAAQAPGVASFNSSGFTPFQGVFAASGFVGVVDKPTSFVVGEAGPEYVSVIPGGGGGAGQVNTALFAGLVDISAAMTKANTAMNASTATITKNNLSLTDTNITLTNLGKSTSIASKALAGSGLQQAADTASGSVTVMGQAANGVGQAMFGLPATMSLTGTAFGGLAAYANSTGANVTVMGMSAGSTSNQLSGMSGSAQQAEIQFLNAEYSARAASQGLTGTSGAANTAGQSLSGAGQSAGTAGSALNQTGTSAGTASQGLNSAGQSASSAGGSISSFSSQMSTAGQAANSFAQAVNSAAASIRQSAQAATQAAQTAQTAATQPQYATGAGGYPTTGAYYSPNTLGGTNQAQLAQFYANQPQNQAGYYTPYGAGQFAGGGVGYGYPPTSASYYAPYGATYFGFAKGFEGVVSTPTKMVVGEAGPEYVSVIPGVSSNMGDTMTTGLSGLVTTINKSNSVMSTTWAAAANNTTAFNSVSGALGQSNIAINTQTRTLDQNNIAIDAQNKILSIFQTAIDLTSHALAGSGLEEAARLSGQNITVMGMQVSAVQNPLIALQQAGNSTASAAERMGQYASTAGGQVSGMGSSAGGTTGAMNSLTPATNTTTGSVTGLGTAATTAANSLSSAASTMSSAASTMASTAQSAAQSLSAAASAAPRSPYYGPTAFAPYQQYGSFTYGIPTSGQPGSPGVYPGGGGGSPYGAFGAYAGYGNLSLGGYPAAQGFEGFVTSPTRFIAGEAGPEYVSVIPGANVDVGNTMTTGLSGLVNTINKSNNAMSTTWAAATNNTIAFNSVNGALGDHQNAINTCSRTYDNNSAVTQRYTNYLNNASTALIDTTTAADNTTTGLGSLTDPIERALQSTNDTTSALNTLTGAINNTTSALQQQTAAAGGGGVGGSYPTTPYQAYQQGGPSAYAPITGPNGYYGPAAFAGLAQYGNFTYGTPTSGQPGSPGVYPGGGGSSQYGAFGAYSQYGNFSAGTPTSGQPGSPGVYPGGGGGSPYGAFSGLAQYGNLSLGGVQGSQGGSSSPANQQPKQAATGWEGILNSATKFIAGEQGPEHVSIRPVTATAATTDINSIMQLIAELVRQLQNQNMNVNVNSYLDGYQVYKNQQKYTNGRVGNYLG